MSTATHSLKQNLEQNLEQEPVAMEQVQGIKLLMVDNYD